LPLGLDAIITFSSCLHEFMRMHFSNAELWRGHNRCHPGPEPKAE
jgi:hypothetical protein